MRGGKGPSRGNPLSRILLARRRRRKRSFNQPFRSRGKSTSFTPLLEPRGPNLDSQPTASINFIHAFTRTPKTSTSTSNSQPTISRMHIIYKVYLYNTNTTSSASITFPPFLRNTYEPSTYSPSILAPQKKDETESASQQVIRFTSAEVPPRKKTKTKTEGGRTKEEVS